MTTGESVLRLTLEGVNMVHMNWYGGADVFWQAEMPTTAPNGELVWDCICRSEHILKDLNPKWKPAEIPVKLASQFDRHKPIRFSFYDWEQNREHQPMGNFMTSVNQLLRAQAHKKEDGSWDLAKALITKSDSGEEFGRIVVVDAEIVNIEEEKKEEQQTTGESTGEEREAASATSSLLTLTLEGVDMDAGEDIFYCLETQAEEDDQEEGIEWVIIHQSETEEDTANPKWEPAMVSLKELCQGDWDKPIRISFMDEHEDGGHEPLGHLVTTVNKLLNGDKGKALPTESENGGDYGKVLVVDARLFSDE